MIRPTLLIFFLALETRLVRSAQASLGCSYVLMSPHEVSVHMIIPVSVVLRLLIVVSWLVVGYMRGRTSV